MPAERRVVAWRVDIAQVPMARAFTHAAHARSRSESVLLSVTDADGLTGWGESAPRSYVTGESIDSVSAVLTRIDLAAVPLSGCLHDDLLAVVEFCDELLDRFPEAESATAAVETALCDLLGKQHGKSLAELVGAVVEVEPPASAPYPVSLVIDSAHDAGATLDALPSATLAALTVVKLKVGDDMAEALERLTAARSRLGADVAVALDANASWNPVQALGWARRLADAGISWVEEPFPPRSWGDIALLTRRGVPVMLDESFRGEDDLHHAARADVAAVNLRVSKCGGPLRTARLHAIARAKGIRCQLGVQVGEVGPLWAAGRALAGILPDLLAIEAGRQDEWFPTPLTEPRFSIDRAAYLAHPVGGHGHGVAPSDALLPHLQPVLERDAEAAATQ